MHFTPVTILLQLSLCVVVYGRFWGDDFKRQNDELLAARDQRRSPPATRPSCEPYFDIDKMCPVRSYPKMAQVVNTRGPADLEKLLKASDLADIWTDFTDWLHCIQRVYNNELPNECTQQLLDGPVGKKARAVVGLLKLAYDLFVNEATNSDLRKHQSCFANSTLIVDVARCLSAHVDFALNDDGYNECDLDKLYDCAGKKIDATEVCRAGAAALVERVTRPLFDDLMDCQIVITPYQGTPNFVAKILRSMKDLDNEKKRNFFEN